MEICTLKVRLTHEYLDVQTTLIANFGKLYHRQWCWKKYQQEGKGGGSLTQFGVQGREINACKDKVLYRETER